MYEIDEQQIRQWWQVFKGDGKLVEIRLLGTSTYSGYFKDVDTLITALRPYLDYNNERYYGSLQAYFTLNDIDENLYGREQHDKFVKKPKVTTTDANVTNRRFVMIDLDACRVAGVSSSDKEFDKSHMKAVEIYRYLIKQGFKEPIITTSGNGYHCYVTCDMPNDDFHNELVKRFLQSLAKMFSDDSVEVDEKVYNPARVDKLIGTWAKKGSDTQERKWRIAKIVKVPQDVEPNEDALFQKIADLLPKEEPKKAPNRPNRNYINTPFDLRTWLNEHGIVYKEEINGNGTKFVLQHCPWEDTHSSKKEWESALFQNADGQITFSCFHSHCKDKTWFDYRQVYEPDAYNKPSYQPQQVVYIQQPKSQKPKYEIKEEIPELGEKWMPLSSVAKVDLTKLEKVKTGYTELDNRIGGLYMSEVTILSGSNASGKSSWLNSVILNIVQQNYKVALWSGELRADVLKSWLQMVAAGKENLLPSKYEQGRYYVPDGIGNKIDAWLDGKFFLYNNEYGNVASQVLNDVKILTDAGVKVFVIDNMMSMNIDVFDGDKNDKQKQFILALKDFAMKEQVHVILVAHPRKSVAFLRKTDISGSGDIINAVDNCFIFHRVNEDFIHAITDFYDAARASQLRQYGNVLAVEKNRLMGVVDLMVGMHYEVESRRFKNTQYETIHYGWEQEPTQTSLSLGETMDSMPFGAPLDDDAPF
jgi:KaiC/GvpD/RAD55 family RecA-like ATPase